MKHLCLLVTLLLTASSLYAEDERPGGTIQFYEWCLKAKSNKDIIVRLEDFYKELNPETLGGYEDSPHIRYFRLAVYKLVELHGLEGNKEAMVKYLTWLKENDRTLAE